MKKLLNRPENFVEESLRGILLAHSDELCCAEGDVRAICRAGTPIPGKVAIVTGGGYGHLPLFLGYVGQGLCDGCAVGNVFTSPSCETILNTARQVDSGAGILFLFGNYMGDQMNFEMARDFLEMEGHAVEIIRAADDLASAPREQREERRGIAGILFAYKIAGALAEQGLPLKELAGKVRQACGQISSLGVSFSSCQLPESETPIFEISETEMELGMGIHGEKGVQRCQMMSAAGIAGVMAEKLTADLDIRPGDRAAVLVNGLGSTSREELYILYGELAQALEKKGVGIAKSYVGEYVTSLEMAGASASLLKLNGETEELLMRKAHTPFLDV